jgi:hypothetical protein
LRRRIRGKGEAHLRILPVSSLDRYPFIDAMPAAISGRNHKCENKKQILNNTSRSDASCQ